VIPGRGSQQYAGMGDAGSSSGHCWVPGVQGKRRADHLSRRSKEDRVAANDVLEHVLKIPPGNQTPAQTMRLSTVMRKLGWERPNNGNVTIGGKRMKGYFRAS
jgi:hypothetical protein